MFYAFEYKSGRSTTTGTPNENTGRLSIAGDLSVFHNKTDRDQWVIEGESRSVHMNGNSRESVSKKQARNLHLGMSLKDYYEYLDCLDPLS